MICPVCLGSGKRLDMVCGWCRGLGVERRISKQEMIDFIETECKKNNFTIQTPSDATVDTNGVECSAYFCAEEKKLVAARNSVNFFENLLHEFCHLRQFLNQTKAWKESHFAHTDSSAIIEDFITKERHVSTEELKMAIDSTIELEWECENMAMSYLSILTDYPKERIPTYKINAFIYMRFYRAVEHFGCWYKNNKDFMSQGIHYKYAELVKNMPNYNNPITQEEIDVMRECFE